jgi:hypothetical protein
VAETRPAILSTAAFTGEAAIPIATCELDELLENVPLHSPRHVSRLFEQAEFANLYAPEDIRVHCEDQKCDGVRRHRKQKEDKFQINDSIFHYQLVYMCSNCTSRAKVFILKAQRKDRGKHSGTCTKIYQEPAFGSPIPKKLFQVIGEVNREYFLQARRAIARGLGIGAYSYYRRIVESTKFDLVNSILQLAEATNASAHQVALLKRAQGETQFSKAIEMLRDVGAIPAVLLIDGHNPLSLLHDLLSEGLHQLSDSDCLQRSTEAEIVLCEIAYRMQAAMTDRKAVKDTITSIMKRKASNSTG